MAIKSPLTVGPLVLASWLFVACASHLPVEDPDWHKYKDAGARAMDKGDYALAEQSFKAALSRAREVPYPHTFSGINSGDFLVSVSLYNLAALYERQERYVEAENLFLQALAIRQRKLGPEHELVAQVLDALGLVYRKSGQYDKAESVVKRALTICEKNNRPCRTLYLNSLAHVYEEQGRYTEAEPLFKQALEALELSAKLFKRQHPDYSNFEKEYAAMHARFANDYAAILRKLGKLPQ